MKSYHLLKEVPNVLRVSPAGELYCSDGRDVKEYLKEKFAEMPEGEPVALVPSSTLKSLNSVAWLVPHLSLAC